MSEFIAKISNKLNLPDDFVFAGLDEYADCEVLSVANRRTSIGKQYAEILVRSDKSNSEFKTLLSLDTRLNFGSIWLDKEPVAYAEAKETRQQISRVRQHIGVALKGLYIPSRSDVLKWMLDTSKPLHVRVEQHIQYWKEHTEL